MAKPAHFISNPAGRSVGGQLPARPPLPRAQLRLAYCGVTRFESTGWAECVNQREWVLDYLNHGQQRQRIGRGQEFLRPSGLACLYAPGQRYYELRHAGTSLDEAYILFRLDGDLSAAFRQLTGRAGYCHFRDPEQLVRDRLRALAELLFHRRPGFELLAHGLFLELLGRLLTAPPEAAQLRTVADRPAADLPGRVERYIRQHLSAAIHIADLARHVGLSPSRFAHAYRRLTGESPYRAVQRLKVQAAKERLLQQGLTVKETAAQLGFSTQFQFSRAFKRVEGVAPKQYVLALQRRRVTR